MKDKIAWALLAKGNSSSRKMARLAEEFESKKSEVDLDSAEAKAVFDDFCAAEKAGAEIITYLSKSYPEELKRIPYPPAVLYAKGKTELLSYPLKVTMVGSRGASAYGMAVAAEFSYELSESGVCVISGGARGIDTASLRGAMRGRGSVICVIGTGIDVCYPKENKGLFEKVCEKGLLLSEFPMGTGPLPGNFPIRNRIMACLCDSLVVVEAAERSGALISAAHALDYGKTIFAVPGNIDSKTSAGTNALLRDGAMWALSGSDILFELMERKPEAFRRQEDGMEALRVAEESEREIVEEAFGEKVIEEIDKAVLNAIGEGKHTYEEILEYCECDAQRLTSVLTVMQIKGMIVSKRNKYFEA